MELGNLYFDAKGNSQAEVPWSEENKYQCKMQGRSYA